MTRVLIADDHPYVLTGVESVLRHSGFAVTAVSDGRAALDGVERENPDVLILDVRMAGLGGIEVLQTLRAGGDRRPVILLTAELADDDLAAAVAAEVNGIVFKDGAERRLLDAISAVLEGEQYIDPPLLERAKAHAASRTGEDPLARLTPRERVIAEAVAKGMRNRDIAAQTGLTEGSVKVYLHHIYAKLQIDNRTELAILALGLDLGRSTTA